MLRLALALMLLAGDAPACPPVSRPMSMSANGDTITVSGQITDGSAGMFAVLVATNHPRLLVLDSNGGLIAEAAAMADTVRTAGLDIAVPPRAMCASACFMLFAAGRHRTVAADSRIGVHRAATNCGADDSPSGTEVMEAKAVAFGTPSGVVRRMVSTPQPGIAWLTADELADMGVRLR